MSCDFQRAAVAELTGRLASGYYAFLVSHLVTVNPKSINSLPPSRALGEDPVGEIRRKDGTSHELNLRFYLDLMREDRQLQGYFLRSWATGALLVLGDELNSNQYFDHAPILELVYHLRNGLAHGNKFSIDDRGRKRLEKYPAHNRDAAVRSPCGTLYEITPNLTGPVLFDSIGAADVIDVLQSTQIYLST